MSPSNPNVHPTHAYIARKRECNCVRSLSVDNVEHAPLIAAHLYGLLAQGYILDRVPREAIKDGTIRLQDCPVCELPTQTFICSTSELPTQSIEASTPEQAVKIYVEQYDLWDEDDENDEPVVEVRLEKESSCIVYKVQLRRHTVTYVDAEVVKQQEQGLQLSFL